MESALSTLGFVIFGFTFSTYAFLVDSHSQNGPSAIVSPPPSSPSRSLPPPPPLTPLIPPPLHSPPPRYHRSGNHGTKAKKSTSPPKRNRMRHRRPPPPPPHPMNGGKKVGLLFAGIAGIMQIGVVGFLIFKRRQLLKTKDIFEADS